MVLPVLKVYLLGGFRLLDGEVAVTAINTPRLQALLAYLVLHRHAPQPRSHLAFLFWPDSTEAQARTNLRYLYYPHLSLGTRPELKFRADNSSTLKAHCCNQKSSLLSRLKPTSLAYQPANQFAGQAAQKTYGS
jgi:hypothetical protein